jgi:exosome complex component RRP45
MPRNLEISNVEKSFVLEALSQGIRLDGRDMNQFRDIGLEFGNEYGTVTVNLGRTRSVQRPFRSPSVLMLF